MYYRIVYVAGALTNATQAYKRNVQHFKELLRERTNSIVLRWVGEDAEIDPEFFSRDLGNVNMCDVLIALVDQPSIGIGIELSHAISMRKLVLCLHHTNSPVSRMVRAAVAAKHAELSAYVDLQDAADIAADFIKKTTLPLTV